MYTGLQLTSFKQLTNQREISVMPAPNRVSLLLDQHADALLRPCVKPGDVVTIGQVIAIPEVTFSASLHSPVSGSVESVNDQSINIINDHQQHINAANSALLNWRDMDAMKLITYLAQGGITGLGGAGYSTAAKLALQASHKIQTLVINGMECEPYITCDDRLMREHAKSIVAGTQILLAACCAPHCLIAVENDKPEAIAALRIALDQIHDSRIELRVLPTAYPNGDEGRLIKLLINRDVPREKLPSSIGVIVHNVATARACEQWIMHGKPLIARVVTVTGHGIQQPCNVEAWIGTSVSDLILHCGGTREKLEALIVGGMMMGRSVQSDDLPITKTTNCIIAATPEDAVDKYQEQPCIRCGECAMYCPANLLPQQLLMYLRNQNTSAAVELGLQDCIECGCCDAVCPSHILLASRFRSAKQQLQRK